MRHVYHRTHDLARSMDKLLIRLAARHGTLAMRVSLGIVFLWFAVPKFFPGVSAVDDLALRTIGALTLQLVPPGAARLLLALLELGIALGMLTGRVPRLTLAALMFQMAGTLTPLLLFPHEMWTGVLIPSLEGQFIIKNLVFVAGGFVLAEGLIARRSGTAERNVKHPDPTTAVGRDRPSHVRSARSDEFSSAGDGKAHTSTEALCSNCPERV